MLDALARTPAEQLARILPAPVVTLELGTRPTLRACLPVYLRYLLFTQSKALLTVLAYGQDLRAFIVWCETRGVVYPDQVTHREFDTYCGARTASGLRGTTVARTIHAARSLWKWLQREDYATRDPARLANVPRIVKQPPIFAPPEQQDAALATLAADSTLLGRRDHALIGTGFYAGLRAAELATLTLARVDLAGDSAALRVLGKGQRERIVPVVPTLRAILTAYLRDTRPALEAAGGPSPYLFLRVPKAPQATVSYGRRRAGLPLTTRTVWYIVVGRLRPLLGQGFSPHKMRHSFGARLRWNSGDSQILQQLLGHVSISTTMIYSHLPTRDRAAEVARLLAPTMPAAGETTGRAPRRDLEASRADRRRACRLRPGEDAPKKRRAAIE
jgi:site-specific recombinase XerD